LYAFSVLIETLIEGRLVDSFGRHRMEMNIARMHDHVVICGWGRVGRSIASEVAEAGRLLVVIDNDPERLAGSPYPTVLGDATEDATLAAAGIDRATALIAAVDADAANSFIILSARAVCPELFIVARARSADSEEKLRRAGADRVVNPQHIGGARMAAFVLRPHVAEFVDVVMHDRNLEFRLEELTIGGSSPLARKSMREARIRDRTGALVLAVREAGGQLRTNPSPETTIEAGDLLIAIGTETELRALADLADTSAG
jgi:voltage-gated potassium channel